MVSVQAGCSIANTIAPMKGLAVDTDSTLEEIATMVIEREIRIEG